jgi:SNF2 family DNA or RNA helicase
MSYPPFESALSYDGQVQTNNSGKQVLSPLLPLEGIEQPGTRLIVIIGRHKYYSLFTAKMMRCAVGNDGSIKGPFLQVNPLQYIWEETNLPLLKFFMAIVKLQAVYENSQSDFESLQALVNNPAGYEFFYHNNHSSDKITANSLTRIKMAKVKLDLRVIVTQLARTNKVYSELSIDDIDYPLPNISIQYSYFLVSDNKWYLADNRNVLNVLTYFVENGNAFTINSTQFANFKHDVLAKIELVVPVKYSNTAIAKIQVHQTELVVEKIIYLSELNNFVCINPVVKYGETEVPILSKRQLYQEDGKGNRILIERDGDYEDRFIALLLKQYKDFAEQLTNPLLYFYLPKSIFLDQHWFLNMFDEWTNHNIRVFGFNSIKQNKFTPHKAKIRIEVSSGINWFNTELDVRFGATRATLKQILKSLKNRSHYVELDNGKLGVLPSEWVEKFKAYFRASEIENDYSLRLNKTCFSLIDELYGSTELDTNVRKEISGIAKKLATLNEVKTVSPTTALLTELRPYQMQGLSWLNLLDDLNFGGCLADDMGLGKSVQIIAFILLLKKKTQSRTHLIVATTTLLHSWQQELTRFAPSLSVHIHHGNAKIDSASFKSFDIIITSYGTLVSDITTLSGFTFDYIFLDESQNIKNPSSQRFKAAQLLHSRNKITISGTPFENSVWDLYAQFAFACPGLLGNRQYFRDTFGIPIGKFKSNRASDLLRKKIRPFVLRRTKQEVADELPQKTEMVLYCEMNLAQRELYFREESKFKDSLRSLTDDDVPKHTLQILKGLTRLRQICNSPILLKDEPGDERSGKLDLLMEQIASLHEQHKILVFSQFVSMLELIEKRLSEQNISYTTLTGKTKKRQNVIEEFQHDESIRVFLISLKAGGTGINLMAADYVFIVDPWWNPSVEGQAIDRAYRIGQVNNVVAVRLLSKDTIEEKIAAIQQSKGELGTRVLETNGSLNNFSKNNLLSLLNT